MRLAELLVGNVLMVLCDTAVMYLMVGGNMHRFRAIAVAGNVLVVNDIDTGVAATINDRLLLCFSS